MALPLLGAIVGSGVRFVAQRAVQAGARQLTAQGLRNQAVKQTFMGATGLGMFNATPAQAPGRSPQDQAHISPEASEPEPAQPPPDMSGLFNGAP